MELLAACYRSMLPVLNLIYRRLCHAHRSRMVSCSTYLQMVPAGLTKLGKGPRLMQPSMSGDARLEPSLVDLDVFPSAVVANRANAVRAKGALAISV
jgi:hypothetical protein